MLPEPTVSVAKGKTTYKQLKISDFQAVFILAFQATGLSKTQINRKSTA